MVIQYGYIWRDFRSGGWFPVSCLVLLLSYLIVCFLIAHTIYPTITSIKFGFLMAAMGMGGGLAILLQILSDNLYRLLPGISLASDELTYNEQTKWLQENCLFYLIHRSGQEAWIPRKSTRMAYKLMWA